MFSKKHRAVVERQQPNCDRHTVRQITADWWHVLATNEKLRYHEMALKVVHHNSAFTVTGTHVAEQVEQHVSECESAIMCSDSKVIRGVLRELELLSLRIVLFQIFSMVHCRHAKRNRPTSHECRTNWKISCCTVIARCSDDYLNYSSLLVTSLHYQFVCTKSVYHYLALAICLFPTASR